MLSSAVAAGLVAGYHTVVAVVVVVVVVVAVVAVAETRSSEALMPVSGLCCETPRLHVPLELSAGSP